MTWLYYNNLFRIMLHHNLETYKEQFLLSEII